MTVFSPSASALACNWLGGSGDWHDPVKWSCGQVPTDMDDVTLNLSSFGATVSVNAPAPAKTLNFTSNGATLSGTGALLVSDLATINAITTTTISTNGSRLPSLTASVGAGGYVFTLTDPALTVDSLVTVNVSGVLSSGGSSMVFDVGARDIGTLSLQNATINLRAPLTVTAGLTWFQSSISSSTAQPLTLATGSVSTLSGGANNLFTELITRGTLTWNDGLFSTHTLPWTNYGTLNLQGTSTTPDTTYNSGHQFGNSSMAFFNYGTINANHTGTLKFETAGFNNHGTININSGTLWTAWSPYTQYAGMLRFNGGRMAGSAKCCSLDATQIYLRGGVLSGGGNALYDIVGGIENDGGTVLLDNQLTITNFYMQTTKGTLAVTINGPTAGTDFGVMNVMSRPGVNSNGSVQLAGSLKVDRGPAFTPRSGDRFTVITATGGVAGGTSNGSGSMYPAFAAFAGAGQVVIAEPAQALLVQARADQPSSLRGASNGYTVQLVNPTTAAIGVSNLLVAMPLDFGYTAGSSSGLVTANPIINDNSGAGTRELYWFLPATVNIPPGGSRTLHFGITVGAMARLQRSRIGGTISGPGLSISYSNAAPLEVKVASAISSTTISIQGANGVIQQQGGSTQLVLPRSVIGTTTINLRTRVTCPPEYQPCGNLRTVYVGQASGGRYHNVRQLILDPDQSEPNAAPPSGAAMRGIAMRATTGPAPAKAQAGNDYGFWTGQIPGSGVIPGVPQKLFPDWDNHRPCIAFNGDGNGLYPVGCVGGGDGGGDDFGTPQLYDPSGIITDATNGQPIVGATVTLYRQIPGLPDTSTLTRQCRTIDTRGGSVWTGTAPDTGVFEQPGFLPAQMSPDVNPQITGADGRYGWNVVTGCWYVKVSAPGYASKISALVGVPPEVTDLHIALQPIIAGAVNLTGVVSRKTHGSAGSFDLPIDTAAAIGGAVSVESRIIGAGHMLVFQFDGPITSAGSASVVDGASNPLGAASAAASGNEVIVTLINIPDNQRVRVALTGVNNSSNAEAAAGFLVGDINGSRSVNATDISGVKARSGQATDASNFRFDINASGGINATDISAVKARAGLVLP